MQHGLSVHDHLADSLRSGADLRGGGLWGRSFAFRFQEFPRVRPRPQAAALDRLMQLSESGNRIPKLRPQVGAQVAARCKKKSPDPLLPLSLLPLSVQRTRAARSSGSARRHGRLLSPRLREDREGDAPESDLQRHHRRRSSERRVSGGRAAVFEPAALSERARAKDSLRKSRAAPPARKRSNVCLEGGAPNDAL